MDTTDFFADKRQELSEVRAKLEREIATLRDQQVEIDLELEAIAAYDEVKSRKTRSLDAQVQARVRGGPMTRDAVLAVVVGAGNAGVRRSGIISALGAKGDRSREAAIDNRLRELKNDGRVLHEGRVYIAARGAS